MSNVVALNTAPRHADAAYVTAWSDYYTSCRSTMDRDSCIRLAASHVNYLKKRDAEILAGVAKAMGEA